MKEILIVCSSEKEANDLKNSGFTVKNKNKNEITLKVKNTAITSSLKNILNNFEIEEFYIIEPPIDEIIGKLLVNKECNV